MHTDSNSYVSYFASTRHHLPPSEHQTSLHQSVGSARMTGSPYSTDTQLDSNPLPGLNHGQFSPPGQPISSYRTPSHCSPLRRTSLGHSPYSSEIAAASAESPLSSSSANESPLPEPPIDNMDNDITAHVATGNDDHYPYAVSDDVNVGYPYGHIGARPFPLPSYVLENPDFYKQPVSALLPLNISLAMGYSWSPEAKKFQPLYPPIQQMQRQDHSPKYTSQPSVAPSVHFSTRSSSVSAQSFGHNIAETELVYPPSLAHSRHYTNAPTSMAQHQLLSGYPNLRRSTSVKHENGVPFPDLYNQATDVASSTNGLGAFDALLESGSPTFSTTQVSGVANRSSLTASPPLLSSSSTLDLALYAQSPTNPAPVDVPVLSAPVPRHSAYFGTSLVDNCERTCQEQEEQQERQALRVQTQGLQEQRTVRPAEVSPIMGFAGLPEGGDEDADGEPDVEPFSLHDGRSISGNSTGRARHTREEGVYDYAVIRGSLSGTASGEDADGTDERNGHDLDYRPDEDDDDGDGDFEPRSRATSKNTRSLRSRSTAGRTVRYHPYGADVPPSAVKHSPRSPLVSAADMSPTSSSSGQVGKTRKHSRTLPIPVPVPNLTKKSRGRRVPTVNGNNSGRSQREAALGARIYLCDVTGCGKCFARGEHLKRHIRSIHTYEKPHKCPYPGCGKEFSRHDNLGQHMKVHKDFPKVMERMRAGEA